MKFAIVLALLVVLFDAATARHVKRMETKEDVQQKKDVLFFQPESHQSNVGNATTCKNPKYFCSDGRPCCEKPGNGSVPNCCPYPQGVCCPDGIHCCPRQSFCDMQHHRCFRKSSMYGFADEMSEMALVSHQGLLTQPQAPKKAVKDSLECPDGSKCPNGQTCCKDNTGVYACCPLPEAICCEDHIHCCPKGYKCDTAEGKCSQGNSSISLAVKGPTMSLQPELSIPEKGISENESIPCPGGAVSCPNQYTCCQIQSGGYGCCPLPQAVCCQDGIHCCPSDYRCDVSVGTCNKGDKVLAWFSKQAAVSKPTTTKFPPNKVTCPDMSTCPNGQTCCQNRLGNYACCPLPKAVCCPDKLHCCPGGYTCDVAAGRCNRGNHFLNLFTKQPSEPAVAGTGETCPDQSTCPSGNTCCEDQEGSFACCPLPSAVCCSDKLHCCPEGYTCDVGSGTCSQGSDLLTWFTKTATRPAPEVREVTCPDQSECPSGQTCCEDQQGGYACCPLLKAVCCSDRIHCCPEGYTCDVAGGRCNKGTHILNLFRKQPSKPVAVSANDVTCPDQSTCPSESTCCEDQQGHYECCPLPNAVCCADKLHCCPTGYTCDVTEGKCNMSHIVITWFTKQTARPAPVVNEVTCPDQSECPSGQTCCEDQQGEYACCPLPKAVCCSDKVHCCPEGYTCDVSGGRCNKGNDIINLFKKQAASPAPAVNGVTCPDQSVCPSGNTCCLTTQGGYGCCPVPNAVCCSDKVHCCPEGYTCDVSGGTCNRGEDVLSLFKKQAASPAPAVNEVTCPDQSMCPSGNTCCENEQGAYGCCPLPHAVCCSDKVHCCPEGYTCDVSGGTCNRGEDVLSLFKKQAASPAPAVNEVTCPDQSMCPSGNTCCENEQGVYGCCPLPHAVCCSDKVHCCPEGYTCDVSGGTCNKGKDVLSLFKKQAASPAPAVNEVTCPDQSMCPSGNTCCENEQGVYGCCPLPHAVCCSDKVHCCPEGYTCDVSGGTCNRGEDVLSLFKKQAASPAPAVNEVTCPDQSMCPSGNTCCENEQGVYGCCPLPHAVCCSDKVHCCPEGYTCDVSGGTCNKGKDVLSLFKKQAASPAPAVNEVTCPDQSMCPSGNTCCENEQGVYGCCPLPHAVCCSDKVHCCPEGYTCDVSGGTCNRGEDVLSLFKKQAASPAPAVNEVTCPDQSMCPSGNTCCENEQGVYGCCPLPHAVCCSDKVHCCPEGYTCDVSGGTCNKGKDVLSLFKKQAASPAPAVNEVTCPDQSMCPSGNTCCENEQGVYGCCPLPHAVCCSDKVHCCPEGYTCDVSGGTCNRGEDVLSLFKKQAASPAPAVNEVTCPDQSMCPSGNTCCENEQGVYGCCPLPHAVCCSDKVHCCPEGYTCDVSGGTCNKGKDVLSLFKKQAASPAPAVNEVTCPDQSMCPSGNTCCENEQGVYGCCPLPHAVCCSDKVHCCPEGYTCDVSGGTCNRGEDVLSLFKKQAASPAPAVNEVTCPDQSMCPSGNTCCENEQGVYGCCPLPHAVCCSDKVHCCPEGYTCDVSGGTCNKGKDVLSLFKKQAASPAPAVNEVTCPDQSMCPSGNTCCENEQGVYGCCPLPHAVCCSDKVHCCPEGYTCDVSGGTCNRGEDVLSLFKKQAASPAPAVNEVTCPDQSMCPSGNTCCENEQGVYGCCPLPHAVCCSDKVHCCPEGYTCDVSGGTCNKGKDVLSLFKKQAASPAPAVNEVTCPDQSMCPSGNTCCENEQGVYGCCPLPHAVCCSDKVHCCPEGYTCDVSGGTCNRGEDVLSLFKKQAASPAPAVNEVTCPDQSMCPSGNTCCENEQGVYGCCPLPHAVCCSDKVHCCPEGYTCDVSGGTCNKGKDVLSLFKKQAASPAPAVNEVTCPDQSMCPSGNTCCENEQGVYGCCPLPHAVCCSDKVHCCPEGYTCDVSGGTCNRGEDVLSLFKKQAASPAPAVNEVTCPDQSMCPSGNTCCENEQGVYGCCPLPHAVCCSDKVHCCPEGYTCDVSGGTCNKGKDVLSLFKKQAASPAPAVNEVTCPDQSMCPSGNTCCENEQGVYGCCPLPHAVCCSDKVHCCPEGYTCDVSGGTCNRGEDVLSLFKKQAASPAPAVNEVTCPDQSMCPSGNTCCENEQGVYGCCPLPHAVCCSDKVHCCPEGYTCDVSGGTCNKGKDVLSLFKKQAASPAPAVNEVTCPDQSMCPSGNTCCENEQGVYGCCPLPHAVCCSDKVHCCPEGYTCDVSGGTCNRGEDVLSLFKKQAASPAPAVNDVTCPDQSMCPSGNTCCENEQGAYGCCPLPHAVCCSDKVHCCPEGYTCDVSGGTCNRGEDVLSLIKKQAASPAPAVNEVTCPDQSMCPSGNTCCENEQGAYGCCPLPHAVCCSDKVHCCPEGYSCDVSGGTCNRGEDVLSLFKKQAASPAPAVNEVTCPDQSMCPSGNTCCENEQGVYGCCPLPHAVCCSDKVHCCPEGYTCDVSGGTCNRGEDVLSLFKKQAASPAPAVNEVTCPDQSMCPSGNTCCENEQGAYGCCPLPHAVCCSDKVHCCPEGYTCDVSGGTCNRGKDVLSLFKKQAASPAPAVNEVTCPDESMCPSGNTCCENEQGAYGCCPLPHAVCCSDKVHCCLEGYTCDVSGGTCNRGEDVLSLFKKQAASPAPAVNEVTCPDQSMCPSGNTCCENEQGAYGCCPLPHAVCCSDKVHCCPEGYTCDVSGGTCNRGEDVLSLFKKQAASPAPAVNEVTCPDQSMCPSGNTCCENEQGAYGCCPLPHAVCCSDKVHCCLEGYTCDVSGGTCNRGEDVLRLFKKQAVSPAPAVNDVTCPDQSMCPSGNTCCENEQGVYGCCPLPHAVCCSDKVHCCPEGYTCDVSGGTCNKGKDVLSLFKKKAASPAPAVNEVTCPDESMCPSGNTCCENEQGAYGCCPLPHAVCCSDKVHCCPEGYTCDVSGGTCNRGEDVLRLFKKQAASPAPAVNGVTCPDQSMCPSGNTCCENEQGAYGCCPLPHALCCSDRVHCCPEGYSCDVVGGTCNKGTHTIAILSKQPSKPSLSKVRSDMCPDQSECPERNTCCQLQSGGYGCCPFPKAVCCPDKLHCCPHGWECNSGTCTAAGGKLSITWFSKLPVSKPRLMLSVTCPDKSTCSENSTCCDIGQGKYGCCPTPNATCCSDHIHCCPSGFRCNLAGSNCVKGHSQIHWLLKLVATPALLSTNLQCQIPNAVCCADNTHYCPQGTTCDLVNQKCIGHSSTEPLYIIGS